MNKKDLQKELTDRGITYGSKDTKLVLENLLKDALVEVIDGIVPTDDEEFLIDKYEASYTSKGRKRLLGSYATVIDAKRALDKIGATTQHIVRVTK